MKENQPARIMLVEADPTASGDLKKRLEKLGYQVCAAVDSAEKALETARRSRPDAVLMDLGPPEELHGVRAAGDLYAKLETPVLFLADRSDHDLPARAAVRAFGWVLRPVQDQELLTALETALFFAGAEKDRKTAENELRRSESRYRGLFENAPIGIFRMSPSARLLDVNPACAALLGFDSRKEALAWTSDPAQYVLDPESANQAMREVRDKGMLLNYEIRCRRKDGSPFWGNLHLRLLTSSETGRDAIEGFLVDIDLRKKTEFKLAESENKFRALFQNAQIGLFRTRLQDGLVLEGNDRLAQIMGYESRSEMIGSFITADHYVDPGRRREMLEWLETNGKVDNFEAMFFRKDGKKIWVRYTGRIYPEQGFLEGVLADITEEKTAEIELKASEERYRILTENILDGVVLLQNNQTLFTNDALTQVLGLEKNSGEWSDKFPPEDKARLREVLSEVEQGLVKRRVLQIKPEKPGGGDLWVEAHFNAIHWQGLPAVLVTVRDITARKKKELEISEEVARLKNENIKLRSSVRDRYRLGEIIGKSPPMQEAYELILKAAAVDAQVIIYGESGTGKDLAAKAIHDQSDRRARDFVPVNCGAIPEPLLESEFFGYKKGAFTGAQIDKHGYLDLADGGTLFLDEVGEIGLNLQVKLLRALEGGGYTPLGGEAVIRPDIRLIAATNRDLKELVAQGRMREDFFYRIHVIPITLPPLRERREDIPLLAEHFLKQNPSGPQRLPAQELDVLLAHDWPGNVRELQNVLRRYQALKTLDFIMPDRAEAGPGPKTPPPLSPSSELSLKEAANKFEREFIRQRLEEQRWNRSRAAATLGLSRRTLFRKMKELGIF